MSIIICATNGIVSWVVCIEHSEVFGSYSRVSGSHPTGGVGWGSKVNTAYMYIMAVAYR